MSVTRMARRVSALEQAIAPGVTEYVWQETDETTEQAIARRFPEGTKARVVVYCWAGPDDEVC